MALCVGTARSHKDIYSCTSETEAANSAPVLPCHCEERNHRGREGKEGWLWLQDQKAQSIMAGKRWWQEQEAAGPESQSRERSMLALFLVSPFHSIQDVAQGM